MKTITTKKAELLSRHMDEIFCILHDIGENSVTKKMSYNGKTISMQYRIMEDEK